MEPFDRHAVFPEFFARGTHSVFTLRDAENRPFGEQNTPEAHRADVPFELRECPYTGSRNGKQMNVSALRQVTRNWDAILGYAVRLRDEYARHFGDARDVWWLWRFGVCGAALPGFLVARGIPSTNISGAIAGMFKALQGIFMTTGLVLEERLMPPGMPMAAEEFLSITEAKGLYVVMGGACAGPPHMIREFVHALLDDEQRPTELDLGAVVGSFPDLFAYGHAVTCQLVLWQLLDAHCNLALRALRERCSSLRGPAAESAMKLTTARIRQFPDRDAATLAAHRSETIARLAHEGGFQVRGDTAPPALVSQLVALAGKTSSPLANDPVVLGAWAETFLTYILLEREALTIFNELQRRIDAATQQPRKPSIDANHLGEAYFKNLRTMLRAALGVTVSVANDRLVIQGAGSELVI